MKEFADKFEEEVSFKSELCGDITLKLSKALPPLGVEVTIEGEAWRKIEGIVCMKGKIYNITDSGLFGVLSDGKSDFFLPQFKLKVVGGEE